MFILAIDQGTSSTKSLVVDEQGQAVARGSEPLHTRYSDNGFVEQDPEEIYLNVRTAVQQCLDAFEKAGHDRKQIAAIGISNQRETFVVWDKTGKPLCPAVVWQCKRSVEICEQLNQQSFAALINRKTGLLIDPYFSGTKLMWLAQNNGAVKEALLKGEAYFGTIDTWLLFKMTAGKSYATDYTNASRTLLFNLHTLSWDEELIELFGLKGIQLPAIKASSAMFGETNLDGLFGHQVAVTGMIGDSHAAAFGEGCFDTGTAKATLGTGCSILMNIGAKPLPSTNGMVTTICWSTEDRVDYAFEGVIVSCGATIEWLKNELALFSNSADTEIMAKAVADNAGVYLVPAFSGLGSPHWDMERRASITGMSFGTTKHHIVRAALESIPYQIKDVIVAMESDAGISLKELNADGGMTKNEFLVQFLSTLLGKPVSLIGMSDVSALGAAYLAGLKAGVYDDLSALRKFSTIARQVQPEVNNSSVSKGYKGWTATLKNYKAS